MKIAAACLGSSNKQEEWRWCSKCGNLFFSKGPQACAHGGAHDEKGSSKYHLSVQTHAACGTQDKWRWCKRCGCAGYTGLNNGACAAYGAHDFSASAAEYHMCGKGVHGQNGWNWCKNCQVVFFGGSKPNTKCPANGGNHDNSSSGTYQIGYSA